RRIIVLLLIVFVDLLGFGVLIPLIPFYAVRLRLTPEWVTLVNPLVSNTWTGVEARGALGLPGSLGDTAPGLISLNAHFTQAEFFPNEGPDVLASEVAAAFTDYSGSLIFSVGCHSGLSVPDGAGLPQAGGDWAQAFLSRRATFIGNTGYGYGDSDLIAYSERLMVNFVGELADWSEGPPTAGWALMRAKQLYFNSLAAGAFSLYDEKVLSEMTYYGLPMLGVSVPRPSSTPFGGASVTAAGNAGPLEGPAGLGVAASGTAALQQLSLDFTYTPTTGSRGTYYTVAGSTDVFAAGGRPVQPQASLNITQTGVYAQGVLWTGGSFTEITGFDPLIAQTITDATSYHPTEPEFTDRGELYPATVAIVNRFLGIDGVGHERLVVVPGQFRAGGAVTGTERLYTHLDFDIYYAPFEAQDFVAPSLWAVTATLESDARVTFQVLVTDDRGSVARVVVLYRPLSSGTWTKLDLPYDAASRTAALNTALPLEPVEFVVQAVDATGNVALGLDHGQAFVAPTAAPVKIYLPLINQGT
ncbi:MAG: hypothetical protein KA764_03850, partial [Anaerolineales bacterium]|nr:hypothetical protein [Anaerolineales bacterium]